MATVDVDAVIARCVQEIWDQYDTDKSNALDKAETRKFMEATLGEMTGVNGNISDEDFQQVFGEFDKNGDGTISREEMGAFIKKVAGL